MTNTRTRFILAAFAVLLIAVAASAAFVDRNGRHASADKGKIERAASETERAERPAPPDGEMPRLDEKEMRDIVNVVELWTMSDAVQLSEAQLVAILPKFRQIKQMRERFWQARPDRMKAFSDVLTTTEGASTATNDAKLTDVLGKNQETEDAFWKQHAALREQILGQLTPRQRVQYVLWESESPRKNGRMLQALRRMGEARKPEPPPDPPAEGKSETASKR